MVDISELKPGMKIKIVDHWVPDCHENPIGLMDRWLGKTVTVREIRDSFVLIEEDNIGSGWSWFPAAIDRIVTEDGPLSDVEFTPAPDEVFKSLFFSPSPRKEASYG